MKEEHINSMGPQHIDDDGYQIRESLMGTKRKLKVVFMGAGCSGINFAAQLRKRLENVELTIYEKNSDFGGTWFENSESRSCG